MSHRPGRAQVAFPERSVAQTSRPRTPAGTAEVKRFSPYHVIGPRPPFHRTATDRQSEAA